MSDLKESLNTVCDRIAKACSRAGRPPDAVRLIGATKGVPVTRVREAFLAGLSDFGENYIQEAREKIGSFGGGPCWHMIGHVQSNKYKYLPRLFRWVHSVDRPEMLEALERQGEEMKILFEVNIGGEASKHGATVDGLRRVMETAASLRQVIPCGLMTMPPLDAGPYETRAIFAKLRDLLDRVNDEFGLSMKELSMGMSQDYESAIEEGATMVRVGTAIFGERL